MATGVMPYRTLRIHDWFHRDGFPIAVERREPQQPFGMHAHEFSELVVVAAGHGLHVTGDESWPLSAGDVFVISGSRPHNYEQLDNLCLINVLFQPERLRVDLVDLPSLPGYHALFNLEPAWRKRHQFKSRLRLTPTQLRRTLACIDTLDTELQQRNAGFGFMATAAFMHLAGYLSRCYAEAQHPDSRALLRIAQTIGHLESRFRENVRLEELARIAHMSPRSFLRAFHAATGCSPIAYLIQLRINRAAHLLLTTSDSVTAIAFEVGFADSNYFTRQFRSLTGVAPRQFRDQSLSLATRPQFSEAPHSRLRAAYPANAS